MSETQAQANDRVMAEAFLLLQRFPTTAGTRFFLKAVDRRLAEIARGLEGGLAEVVLLAGKDAVEKWLRERSEE
jgi:hypothetical protein